MDQNLDTLPLREFGDLLAWEPDGPDTVLPAGNAHGLIRLCLIKRDQGHRTIMLSRRRVCTSGSSPRIAHSAAGSSSVPGCGTITAPCSVEQCGC